MITFPITNSWLLVQYLIIYSGARIIQTKKYVKFLQELSRMGKLSIHRVNGQAYNCANYPGCTNKRGSNYPGYTVITIIFSCNNCYSIGMVSYQIEFAWNLSWLLCSIKPSQHNCFLLKNGKILFWPAESELRNFVKQYLITAGLTPVLLIVVRRTSNKPHAGLDCKVNY